MRGDNIGKVKHFLLNEQSNCLIQDLTVFVRGDDILILISNMMDVIIDPSDYDYIGVISPGYALQKGD